MDNNDRFTIEDDAEDDDYVFKQVWWICVW